MSFKAGKPTEGQACHCPSCLKSFIEQDWCDNRLTNIDSGGHKLGGIHRETIVISGAQGLAVGQEGNGAARTQVEKEAAPSSTEERMLSAAPYSPIICEGLEL